MSDEVADAIGAVADYIEKNGWWRGGLVGPNGRQVCIMGGVLRSLSLMDDVPSSVGRHPYGIPMVSRINTTIFTQRGYASGITDWNDDPEHGAKDKQDVLDVLRTAEKIERAGFDPDA